MIQIVLQYNLLPLQREARIGLSLYDYRILLLILLFYLLDIKELVTGSLVRLLAFSPRPNGRFVL